jgi:hypothetical protein
MRLTYLKKTLYSLGHSYEKILHSRLRPGLSGLNKHLFSYNLCLSKFCDHCDSNKIEDTEHYLLKCSGYTTPRITLLLNVKHIICPDINITLLRDLCPTYQTKILIEGSNNDLSTVMNQELFTRVFKFIKSTHRFIL